MMLTKRTSRSLLGYAALGERGAGGPISRMKICVALPVIHRNVPANPTRCTRASLDFRVGVDGCFDPEWVLRGTKADHNRREMWH